MKPILTAYVTTSIPYVNGAPHVGHALEDVQADLWARYRRQVGRRTRLQTGSDDNSLKNALAAEREGVPVAALVERNAARFRRLADALGVAYDGFIRTSVAPEHRIGAASLWNACLAGGAIYRKEYRGLYCVGCEAFYTEDELTSEGLCPEHLVPPERVEEENYFFRLSRYADDLHALITSGQLRIVPESRRNEALSFIAGGLDDFSISRSQARAHGWGIPVPGDPTQVMYVWFDALSNYVTALGYSSGGAAYDTYWTGTDERLHVIGKGILRFHAIYWPAILLAAGLPTPTTVFVHGYLTVEGRKIGKSLGNAVDPLEVIARYGADALRWYLLRELHPTTDGDFSAERLVARYNTDLADDLGNLLNRVNAMLHRYRGGIVPNPNCAAPSLAATLDGHAPGTAGILPAPRGSNTGDRLEAGGPSGRSHVTGPDAYHTNTAHSSLTQELAALADAVPAAVATAMENFDPRAALDAIWELVTRGNRAVDEAAPWALYRAELAGDAAASAQLDGVLYALLEAVRLIAVHLEPFLPEPSRRILAALGVPDDAARPYAERVRWGGLPGGTHTAPPAPLFPKLERGDGTSDVT